MWRSRLFWRFFFSILLVVLVTALLSVQFERYLQKQNTTTIVDKTVGQLIDFQAQVMHALGEEDFDGTAELLNKNPHYRQQFLIFDSNDNEILGRDDLPPSPLQQYFQRQLTKEFAQRGLSLTTVVISSYGNEFIIDIRPIMMFHPLLSPRLAGSIIRIVLLLLVSTLVCYWLTKTLTRRIRVLQSATHRIASGEYAQVFSQTTRFERDELGQLGQDVQYLATQLHSSEKARKQMLSDISHELRSPLSRMQVAIELAKSRQLQVAENAKNPDKYLQRIDLEANRMEQLIAQIIQLQQLQLRRQQILENPDKVEIVALLKNIIDDVRYEYQQHDKAIELYHQHHSMVIVGRADLLTSALENIIRNAMSHTADNSCVEVKVRQDVQQITVTVVDAGEGVPENDLPRLFEPFVRLDSSRNRRTGGFGLGLALAKAIVDAHNGKLSAKNRNDASGLAITLVLTAISEKT